MKKILTIGLIFSLIVITSVIKNSTKKIDQEIFSLKENISDLNLELDNVKLEFDYLSSAEKLINYQNLYFENKLTLKNYDTIMNTIKGLVEQLIDNEQSDDEEREETGSPYDKIFTIFSNIICQTKNSDVYVKSFKELIGKYPTFVSNLDGFINEYYTSYENMVDVNPSADYEKYCILTKNNEQRKNKSGFIMGLYNDNLLKVDELVELLKWCLTRVLQGVNEEGNTLLIEELSENIYIIVNSLVNKKEFI